MDNIKDTYLCQIKNFKNIITNTLVDLNKKKLLQILNANSVNKCLLNLNAYFDELKGIEVSLENDNTICKESYTAKLQEMNNNISKMIKLHGTRYLSDLIEICLGKVYLLEIKNNNKYEILNTYGTPIKYTIIDMNSTEDNKKDKIYTNIDVIKTMENFSCIELLSKQNNFFVDTYGIDLILKHKHKILLVTILLENIDPNYINNVYIKKKNNLILLDKPKTEEYKYKTFNTYLQTLLLKDYLVYSNLEIYTRYINLLDKLSSIKMYSLNKLSKEYMAKPLNEKRTILITLLLDDNIESQFISYLLYDLLSNHSNENNIDSLTQIYLYDSLPTNMKLLFKEAIKNTLDYNKKLINFDSNTIPFEQQISLMKTSNIVKEKAFAKLKEIKSKSEDSGTKAKTYLDMLLKIPFGVYTEEEILLIRKKNNQLFLDLIERLHINIDKESINYLTINKHISIIESILAELRMSILIAEKKKIQSMKKKELTALSELYNITLSKPRLSDMKKIVTKYIETNFDELQLSIPDYIQYKESLLLLDKITTNNTYVNNYLTTCTKTLNDAVYGHEIAKKQLLRIIGQWMNGENSGYSFGFEGPPGVGKTSLAKLGLAKCLIDKDNKTRPFAFIAIGGDANSSTLAGHHYTYVGSCPGRLVEILIETETSNPIIFIDELDKISKTEQGKEIIGILTHLIDPSQNSHYQDKYFSGIDIDMSKVLFIFSYNDVSNIDRILLDRIHRIKFDHLTIIEKKVIVRNYILPDVTKTMGLKKVVELSDEVIEYLIDNYTSEAGVRKLKELMFEIVGEINLNILKNKDYPIPITITIEDIKTEYLKDKTPITNAMVYDHSMIGLVNGLWANALGKGGILHIECKLTIGQNLLDLKLTGSLGDVMKESVGVAKTLAWSLLTLSEQEKLVDCFEKTKTQCIHLHAPEGATPKDGPSAGTAITIAIYSLLSKRKVKQHIAITGEIDLTGNVTAIGGLELKILGGIAAGVTEFIYPDKNKDDFDKIIKKYKDTDILNNILFHNVKHIDQVLKLILM
uniref:Lon protease (S16) C-terminal proteolytic domain protein n=1 Tax=Megaviridae environmental sample TaxID=1737588 RepID=A0A5J6VNG1_9VIRU|nr:MAG: Lon protease (S16) C-terminal proteolytic domain protein [Megaviridae environmental sample]